MPWMARSAGPFPIFVREARGARLLDVDGIEYADFCLGDTGAMTGHSPEPVVRAIRERANRGLATLQPAEDAISVALELARRFGLPYWQFALTATDANRFALRMARLLSGRPKVLVFNHCYHGTVDEALASIGEDGLPRPRDGSIGPQVDPRLTTKVVEFNDPAALEAALRDRDVAVVLAEPVMTNVGIVHPAPGFHDELRRLTRQYGTFLAIDETHTICAGPGGCTAALGLEPDFVTLGKAVGGGVPAAAYGFSGDIARRFSASIDPAAADLGGVGGTLAGNPLSLTAMRAVLEEVLTEGFYRAANALQDRFSWLVTEAIRDFGLPWSLERLGLRSEYRFSPVRARSGGEAARAEDRELEEFMHLWALNRGCLLTPFHSMALTTPDTKPRDIEGHGHAFRSALAALIGAGTEKRPEGAST
jgi:glutamate-1-semialdehyde 2,1-aminomutase